MFEKAAFGPLFHAQCVQSPGPAGLFRGRNLPSLAGVASGSMGAGVDNRRMKSTPSASSSAPAESALASAPQAASAPAAAASIALACLALTLPTLLAFNLPPSSTFLNQAAALIGWGSWLTLLALSIDGRVVARSGGLIALQGAFGLLLLAALAAPLWTGLPWSLALSGAGLIGAAALTAQVAAALQQAGHGRDVFRAFCIGLVVAGLASSAIGIVEVFVPDWADGDWIASTTIPGRAVGNMRQPNHLSSLLLWGLIAAVWLGQTRVLRKGLDTLAALLFIFVIVLSGSRTGAVGMLMLAVWGGLDRRLARHLRVLLLLAPVAYAAFWFATSAWADYSQHVFGGETRFSAKGDISSSRYGIWANTLSLIRMHPWAGVGFGEFNFAWTLTPFPGRPVAFFDHTHNLLLQFAVELGLPLTALVTAGFGWALLRALIDALQARADPDPEQAPLRRAAFMMVFMVCVHSLLEYPLWYAYFLLPAAFALGLGLAQRAAVAPEASEASETAADPAAKDAMTAAPPGVRTRRKTTRPLLIGALLLWLGGVASVYDYARVVVIFAPPEGAAPLAQRIVDGRRSWFFTHHADYAGATTAAADEAPPGTSLLAFRGAVHYLLDSRLMTAWANALNDAGEIDRARYVAARLREFHHTDAFFAPCTEPIAAGAVLPFQCLAPQRTLRFEDFR